MPRVGLEPTRIAPTDFKSVASANSATPAEANNSRYVDISVRFGVNLALILFLSPFTPVGKTSSNSAMAFSRIPSII